MKKGLIALVTGLFLASPQTMAAPKVADAADVVADSERAAVADYAVQFSLPQKAIESTIDAGRVARPPSGGLLDTLIVYSLDDKKKIIEAGLREKAELNVAPLRAALKGFDVDMLARATTINALSNIGWIRVGDVQLRKDGAALDRTPFIASNTADRAVFLNYRYEMSPDFSSVRVIAELMLQRKGAIQGGKSAPSSGYFYKQRITSIVQLKTRSYEHHENVATWSADEGRRGKAALAAAFEEIQRLIPYALGLTPTDLKAQTAKNREKAFAAGYFGPLVERGVPEAGDTLLRSDGLIHVQTID